MTHNINKYKYNSTRSDVNQEDLLRNIYFIIKNFGEVENNFQHVFSDLHLKLKEYLFISEVDICSHYKLREGCSYKKAIKAVDRQSRETINKK